ncbi:MAG: ribosomal RNA small subunit methyltransferase A [Parcubacteria group bacterium]|nr:MAG: ribosomal RNA small subunit methyltransferase A [Parcubacteria group bacterium]
MNKTEINFLIKKYKLTPNKLRGQNFLLDEDVLKRICRQANLSQGDLVLEVGPGLGALSKYLVDQAGRVVAFEVEDNFREPLTKLADVAGNLDVYWQDILTLSSAQWQKILAEKKFTEYKVVANIPYYLTGKLISQLILISPQPQSITLLVQKEVAERICDPKKNSLLSLGVAFYGRAKLVSLVSKESFYPQPQVDSAILHINTLHGWNYPVAERLTWQMIRRGFAGKRKKLSNNLATDQNITKETVSAALDKLGLDTNIRAENLSIKNWIDLVQILLK